MRWVDSSTVRVRPGSAMISRNPSRWPGSSPTVGSSSTTTSGSCANAAANPTRCRCPPDSARTRSPARSSSRTAASAASAAPTHSLRGKPFTQAA